MRSKILFGLLLLSGCDKLWGWKLVDCPLNDSRCAATDMKGGVDEDLLGADLSGTGGSEDLANVDLLGSKPSFVSIARSPAASVTALLGTNRGKVISCDLGNAQNSVGVVLDSNDPGVRAVGARQFSEGPQIVLAALSSGDVWKDVMGGNSASERKFSSVLSAMWLESQSEYPSEITAWIVGAGGLVARRESSAMASFQWMTENSGTTADLYAVTGVALMYYGSGYRSANTRLYAVGASGTVLERAAGAWSAPTFTGKPTTALYGVAVYSNDSGMGYDLGGPSDFVWAVGAQGKLVRKRGTAWTAYGNNPPVPTTTTLRAVTLTSSTTGLAVGDAGAVYMLGGNESSPTWTEVIPPGRVGSVDPRAVNFLAVYSADFNTYYLVGTESTVLRFQPPSTWLQIPCPSGQ